MCPLEVERSLDERSWSHVATMQTGDRDGFLPDCKEKDTRDLIKYHCVGRYSLVYRGIETEGRNGEPSTLWITLAKVEPNKPFTVEIKPDPLRRAWIYRFTQTPSLI